MKANKLRGSDVFSECEMSDVINELTQLSIQTNLANNPHLQQKVNKLREKRDEEARERVRHIRCEECGAVLSYGTPIAHRGHSAKYLCRICRSALDYHLPPNFSSSITRQCKKCKLFFKTKIRSQRMCKTCLKEEDEYSAICDTYFNIKEGIIIPPSYPGCGARFIPGAQSHTRIRVHIPGCQAYLQRLHDNLRETS